MEFLEPRDVKGTKFVVERMLDPHARRSSKHLFTNRATGKTVFSKGESG